MPENNEAEIQNKYNNTIKKHNDLIMKEFCNIQAWNYVKQKIYIFMTLFFEYVTINYLIANILML